MTNKTNFLSLELPDKERITSIDFFRAIAIFLVVLQHSMHVNPLLGAHGRYVNGGGIFLEAACEVILSQLFALALPFFFVVAGYFMGQKILSSDSSLKTLVTAIRRLATAYCFWWTCYYLSPYPQDSNYPQALYDQIASFEFSYKYLDRWAMYHLWFLPALIVSQCIILLFFSIKKFRMLFPVVMAYYALLSIETSYATTRLGFLVNDFFSIHNSSFMIFSGKIHGGYYLLFVYAGWYLAANKTNCNPRRSLVFIVSGVVISCFEMVFLWRQTGQTGYLMGTAPLGIGIAMYAFSKPDIGRNSIISRFGRYSFGIYLIHMLLISWLLSIAERIEHSFSAILYPVAVYFLSLLAVIILSKNRWFKPIIL